MSEHSEHKNYQGVSLPKSGTMDNRGRLYYFFSFKLQSYYNLNGVVSTPNFMKIMRNNKDLF